MIPVEAFVKAMGNIQAQMIKEDAWLDKVEECFKAADNFLEYIASPKMIDLLQTVMNDEKDLINRYINDAGWGRTPFEYKQDCTTVVVNDVANLYMAIRLSNKETSDESKV